MPISAKEFAALQGGVNQLIAAGEQQQQDKLRALLEQQQAAKDLQAAQALKQQYGRETPVTVGKAHIGGMDPLAALIRQKQIDKPVLTPAQEQAEKMVGKQIADFEASGGRPAMQKNLQSLGEVQQELSQGKRDRYDRAVGSLFGTLPSLLGVFGSSEKARRDKARNTALTIAKQTDPNPTEKQIEAIMGQIYDPASSDADNLARIQRFQVEQEAKAAQMEKAAKAYHDTGYGTVGVPYSSTPVQPAMPGQSGASSRQPMKKLYSPSRNQTKIQYSDGSEEIVDGRR